MMMVVWAVIVLIVLVSALLIYMEHEWGFMLGGSTVVAFVISYFSTDLIRRSPLAELLPKGANSQFDAFAVTAVVLMVLALIVVAFLVGRRSAPKKDP